MYIHNITLIAMTACQLPGPAPLADIAGPPPTLAVDPPVLGEDWTLRVTGAPPGAAVTFAASRTGSGGTCAPGAAPCWALEGPFILGVASADPAGLASLVVHPDRTFPFPTVGFQAWVDDGVAPTLLAPIDATLTDTWVDVRGEYEGICAVDTLGRGLCSDEHGETLAIPPGPWKKLFNISGDVGQRVCGLHDDGQLECVALRGAAVPPPAGTFVDLDASRTTACALDVAGALSCWSPTGGWALDDPGPYIEVDVSREICALSAAGDIWCEGPSGMRLELAGPFAHIANAPDFACGIDTAGVTTCIDSTGAVTSPPGTWQTFQSYNGIACGLRTDGTISCRSAGAHPTVLAAPTTGDWVQLHVGNRGACALNASGFATCWGGDTGSSAWLPPGWPARTIVSICQSGVRVDGAAEDPHDARDFTFTAGATLSMVRQQRRRMNDRFTFTPGGTRCPELVSGTFADGDGYGWEVSSFHRGWVEFEAFGARKVAFRLHGDVAMGIDKRP